MYDSNGEQVYPEDVLDPEELSEYYKDKGYDWRRASAAEDTRWRLC